MRSPNKEYLALWATGSFDILYCEDTLFEYAEKLLAHNIRKATIIKFLKALRKIGKEIPIKFIYLPVLSRDPDDIAFLLCAHNGDASHLITYDEDLLGIKYNYDFKICQTLDFLAELRQ